MFYKIMDSICGIVYTRKAFVYTKLFKGGCGVAKNQTILIRVTEIQKDAIKRIAVSMKMTVTEFLLYGAMKSVSEMELNELIKDEAYGTPKSREYK